MTDSYFNPLKTYSADEVAELLHCSAATVRTWSEAGLIKGIKTGRFTVFTSFELEDFLKKCRGMNIANLKDSLETKKRLEA